MRNFDVRILGDVDDGCRVEVTASPAGETSDAVVIPALLQDAALDAALRDLRDFRAELGTVRELGTALWRAVFQPPVASRYAESLGMAGEEGLRLRLRIDPIELQLLPWEYLHNPETGQFLTLSRRASLVRYVARPQPIPSLQVEGPLRVLVLISAPTDQQELQVDRERRLIQEAVSPLVEAGALELVVETDARPAQFQDRMRHEFHVLHYIGHGIMARGQGYMVLQNDEGTSQLVSASVLEPLLGGTSLRCIILAACESAAAPADPFLGLAPALVRGGVPAVVAMQMPVPDESAVVFSREFYRSLAQRWPIDACVTEGRLGIRAAARDTRIDWGIPTLFTRSDDGVLFAEDKEQTVERDQRTVREEPAAQEQSGGVNITESTVTFEGDVAGRDMIKTDLPRSSEADESTDVVGSIWQAIRRLLGG